MKSRQIVEFCSSERSSNKAAVFWLDGRRLHVEPAAVHNAASRLCDFSVNGCCYAIVPLETESDGATRALSRREGEVARLIAKGRSTKQIAYDLGISPHTTDEYVSRILLKLGARNRPAMVAVLLGSD
jgi:DNA-binding CsgD family transcriptional regulator